MEKVICMSSISENVKNILSKIPSDVHLEVAAKTRNTSEIEEAILSGARIIGENYVQEAMNVIPLVKNKVEWHFIGRIQENKINKMITLFDMLETVGSLEIAKAIDSRCAKIGKKMDVLIEINSGREIQKSGVMPEDAEDLIRQISQLQNLRVLGLMTMGPAIGSEELRPYFKLTKELFDSLKDKFPEITILSMGMSDSYEVAIDEGANLVRIGTKIFGPRDYSKGQG